MKRCNPDYSSDSSFENYYLHYEDEEQKVIDRKGHSRVDASTSLDPKVVGIANFLKEANKKLGLDIPINMDVIKKKLANSRNSLENKNKSDQGCKKRVVLKKKRPQKNRKIYDRDKKDSTTDTDKKKDSTTDNSDPDKSNNELVFGRVGGRDSSVLVIRRKLTSTDVTDEQHKLSMPLKQLSNKNFLNKDELAMLEDNCRVPAILYDPRNKKYDVGLKLSKSGNSLCYVIGKPWNIIKADNGFKKDMELDVRAFREDGVLCFLLEIVDLCEVHEIDQ